MPCYKEFASLMLFIDSYPPVPLSTWKGGVHRHNFDSRLTAGKVCVATNVANKESAGGGRSSRHSSVTRFADSPTPTPPRRGGGYATPFDSDI